MKQSLPSSHQWTRLAIILLTLCLSPFPFRGVAFCSDSQKSPAGGFLIDMTPLLTTNGGIRAIALDCRALTGYIGRSPFIWSRDFGIIKFNLGSEHFGTGNCLSDDGHVMAGTYRSDTQKAQTPLSLKKFVAEYAEFGMDIAEVRKAF